MLVFINESVWYWFTFPSWLIIVCCDSIEGNSLKNFLWHSCHFCRLRPIGRASKFLLDWTAIAESWIVFVRVSSYWLVVVSWQWLVSWQWRLESLHRTHQVHILLCPINVSFPLPLVGGWLEERLKFLRTLMKAGFEKSKQDTRYSGNSEPVLCGLKIMLEWNTT